MVSPFGGINNRRIHGAAQNPEADTSTLCFRRNDLSLRTAKFDASEAAEDGHCPHPRSRRATSRPRGAHVRVFVLRLERAVSSPSRSLAHTPSTRRRDPSRPPVLGDSQGAAPMVREHFTVFGRKTIRFVVDSRWFQGSTKIVTYELEELLGTKLRALYQRKKGRDLFDLAAALEATTVNPARVVEAFTAYMKNEGKHVTRALFERNLSEKRKSTQFSADITPLLASGYTWDKDGAVETVSTRMIALLPGAPWKKPKK